MDLKGNRKFIVVILSYIVIGVLAFTGSTEGIKAVLYITAVYFGGQSAVDGVERWVKNGKTVKGNGSKVSNKSPRKARKKP